MKFQLLKSHQPIYFEGVIFVKLFLHNLHTIKMYW